MNKSSCCKQKFRYSCTVLSSTLPIVLRIVSRSKLTETSGRSSYSTSCFGPSLSEVGGSAGTTDFSDVSGSLALSSDSSTGCGLAFGTLPDIIPEISSSSNPKPFREISRCAAFSFIVAFGLSLSQSASTDFLLATQCGLRASEIAGLTVDCVKADCIIINKAKVHTRTQGEVIKQPKSAKGYRTIPISPVLSSILLKGCKGESVCGVSSHDITRMWGRFSKYNCLPVHLNFHALRHAFASNCLINGIPQKYTAELMGHSGTTMIDTVYQHTFPSAMQAYANTLIHNADNLLKSDG